MRVFQFWNLPSPATYRNKASIKSCPIDKRKLLTTPRWKQLSLSATSKSRAHPINEAKNKSITTDSFRYATKCFEITYIWDWMFLFLCFIFFALFFRRTNTTHFGFTFTFTIKRHWDLSHSDWNKGKRGKLQLSHTHINIFLTSPHFPHVTTSSSSDTHITLDNVFFQYGVLWRYWIDHD